MVVIDSKQTVREIVLQLPGAAKVLDARHVDYCCCGTRSLAEACAAAGASLDDVIGELESADDAPSGPPDADWQAVPLGTLLQHLLDTHHVFTKTELERLRPLTKKVLAAHGSKHPELERVAALFEALDADLIAHLRKEELVLFPFMRDLEKLGRDAHSPFGPITNPLAVMDEEHEMVCELLRNLRHATKDFAPASDACDSFRELYTGLEALEADLRRHIHLENNVLFPGALALAAKYGVAT